MKTLLLLAGLALGTVAAQAQTAPSQVVPRPMHHAKHQKTPEQSADQHAAKLGKGLGLSADQQGRTRAVYLAEAQEAQAIKAKYPDPSQRKAMHQEMKGLHDKYQGQLKGVLTPDQYTRYTAMQQEKKAHHGHGKNK